MTKLQKATKAAVIDFHRQRKTGKVISVRHIYPRCYVLSRAAGSCLIVSCPPVDAEPHLQKLCPLIDGGRIVHIFDESLRAGDWCSCAYVSTASSGQITAVKAVS